MSSKDIKSAIIEWKKNLIDNLRSHKNKKIEVYFIPKEWESDKLDIYNLKYFSIKNKNDLISSNSEFFIIEKEYFKDVIKEDSKKILIKTEAKFENDKLIIDLGNDNFYFYYLNSKNNLCEGHIESKGENKQKSFTKEFKFFTPHDFVSQILKEGKPEIKDNLVIYYINNFIFTYKNDEELINDLNKQNINYKDNYEDNNNKTNNDNNTEIIKCIIYYFFSEYKYKTFLEEPIKYKSQKRINKNELKFILINKEWINLFKEKYNYKHYKKKIDEKEINEDNYLNKLKYFKDINSEIIEIIKSTKVININSMNNSYKIFQNYELITPEAYDILVKCFGSEKNEENIELSTIKIDSDYILVKYNSKMIEIIKIKEESKRYLIIGQNDLDDNILKELLDNGFKTWLKHKKITEPKNYSNDIIENGKMIGKLYYLPKLNIEVEDEAKKKKEKRKVKFSDNNIEKDKTKDEKDDNQNIETNNNNVIRKEKKSRTIKHLGCPLSLPPEGLVGLQNVGATCYMNAALQCFSNIENLRVYFLDNKSKIKNEKNKLSSSLLTIFENLWEEKNITYYIPQEFKDVISEMNPLFKGIQANDTKDLILFILETIHNELNEVK